MRKSIRDPVSTEAINRLHRMSRYARGLYMNSVTDRLRLEQFKLELSNHRKNPEPDSVLWIKMKEALESAIEELEQKLEKAQ